MNRSGTSDKGKLRELRKKSEEAHGNVDLCKENIYLEWCAAWEDGVDILRKPEVFLLYYAYHFNHKVKKAGAEQIEIRVGQPYIDAIRLIQKRMQDNLRKEGWRLKRTSPPIIWSVRLKITASIRSYSSTTRGW